MGFVDFIKNLFSGERQTKIINIYLKDNKCDQKVKVVLRKGYDIVREYDDQKEAKYSVRKVIVCDNCYNKINLYLEFDKYYNIINKEIENGQLITKEEFYA
jgi:hypothetical protein